MQNFNNLGNQKPQLKNQIWTEKGTLNFSSHASTHNINNIYLNKSFLGCWLKTINKKGVKTINKVPQRKDWPNPNQREITVEELLKKFGEYGIRTGTKLGNKYFEGVDIDIEKEGVSFSLRKRFRTNFEFLAKIYRISYIRTKKGYHVYCLFEQLTPNEVIYHLDKYGVKRNIGSILSKGRQIQGVGSKDKAWVNNGKWFWHLKDREELKTKLSRFFFLLDNIEKNVEKTSKSINFDIITNESLKFNENISKNFYKTIKLENIRITSKQATKKVDHYRVNYQDKWQNSGFFFLDSYFRDKKERIQPNLTTSLVLLQGYKYQFFASFG
ncbi:MAG: hypothetical protein MRECE_21c015 [Mycoplasmataceae bacterium CE_OT135]|nr:MAG: hypothetical protein MRECE_21c015 [Mycoplasmataceae bacterium CE_OT135]